ncbi:MAG: hypothetical protein GFH27_549301n166 [Chloroflexi bacterium AL-W]|nr:hypothetical protein [Chloroflexi bacterium AL-N1]NOK68359.1 hypothetical protein [Chloroflexi bacterium AL-N10]NOK74005.1 hypothetical protein [Chloroflexi bacterium AL-N5]NOK82973.1 hypothetical protein [Chloroflexi bacterium AL-W]NOK90495.1 hypothetical protein [Chloroflexi bacterium AL-N15]
MYINTARLLLREFITDNLDAMMRCDSDPLVVQYVCYGPLTQTECEQELAFHIAHQLTQPRTFYPLHGPSPSHPVLALGSLGYRAPTGGHPTGNCSSQ